MATNQERRAAIDTARAECKRDLAALAQQYNEAVANREKLCKQEVVNLERAIKAAEIEEIREARLEIQRILVERGLRAEQILDGLPLKAVKAQRKPQAPSTVRHTGPEGQVWSGRGRAPNWFKRQQGALGGGQV